VSEPLQATFSALADPARLAVIGLLRRKPLRSSEIARRLSLNRPLVSKHLQVLRKAGLIEERADDEDARARVYRLRAARFTELRSWLDHVETFWTGQLVAFKHHAERKLDTGPGRRT
jgi:DNA-binding transcriptional ArsR family regulator